MFYLFSEESKMVPLQRSESMESTMSEREFRKRYQAITHRMVHRKSSAVMYSRILERTFGKYLLRLLGGDACSWQIIVLKS